MFRSISTLVLGLGLLALVAFAWHFSQNFFRFEKQKSEHVEVILEQMKAVTKLVTAEGYFSEVYDYKDYYQWDIIPLRKKALMRVKAKVVMGYDLEQLQFNIDSGTKRVTVSGPTTPQIIALEHDVDYYDLTSGAFNRFSEKDLNALNDRAKNFITEVAMQSNLVEMAETRKNEILRKLDVIASTAGYELEVEEAIAMH